MPRPLLLRTPILLSSLAAAWLCLWPLAPLFADEVADAEVSEAEEGAPAQVEILLEGRLTTQTVKEEGATKTLYVVRVGPVDYELTTGAEHADPLRRAKGKYISLRGAPQDALPEGAKGLVLSGTVAFEMQTGEGVVGVVKRIEADKRTSYALETAEGLWEIAAKDARHVKKFEDLQVAVTGFRATDGRYRALEGVKKVVRSLREGERAPETGEGAIGAGWKGVLTALKVPKGIPGVEPGDFALHFQTDGTLDKTEGRVMDAYDVVGVRVRKFNGKKRSAKIELAYSFGQGSYAINLEGTFSADWKTFSGDWKSGFLGSGTFRLEFVPPTAR
jgi:hypothetical protein